MTTTSRHHGLLGTVVELSSTPREVPGSGIAHLAAVEEIERLQQVVDASDEDGDLRRWLAGSTPPTPDLVAVLDLAEQWRRRSNGAFDPAAAVLTKAWSDAAVTGRPPGSTELDAVVATIRTSDRPEPPRWDRPTVSYALDAIAKGWIVDRAVEAAWSAGRVRWLTVDAGGDLVHRGGKAIVVGIDDPLRPHPDAAPVSTIRLRDAALATSGGAGRGWTIAGTRYADVIDPRSGRPVDHHASVSVVATDAVTAGVVATIVRVLPTDEGLAFVEALDGPACCIVTPAGEVHRSRGWPALEVTPTS